MTDSKPDPAADLRRRAERALAQRPPAPLQDEGDLRRLVQELQLHQIELELQNEALRQSEMLAQEALQQLADLNDAMEEKIARRTAQLAAAVETAESASRAKSAFLSNMSHELRTPMSGVIGMIELALRRATDPKQIDWLDKARTSAHHLLGVVNDILDLSKIEAGEVRIEALEFTLGPVLQLLADLVTPDALARGIGFAVELPDDLADRPWRGDRQHLGQVLLNLAGNAVKFTDRGCVTVRVRVDDERDGAVTLRFEVEDSGIGIAAEELPRLFQAFRQVDDSLSRRHGGTGLGLAICAHMVRLMDGQIGVRSAPGVGSTFWFTVSVQAVAPDAPARAPPPQAGPAADLAGRRVLLAEDNPVNQEVTRGLLEDIGMRVDVAADGAAAVAMAQADDYAIILMDVQLPGLSGIEATRAIRAASPHGRTVPIIALTASVFEQDRVRCIEAGMDDHLPKPVVSTLLFEMLSKWLRPAPPVQGDTGSPA